MDRMDLIVTAAVRQGFLVTQTRKGAWMFRTGITTVNFSRTPRSPREWVDMVNTLRGAGLRFPDEE